MDGYIDEKELDELEYSKKVKDFYKDSEELVNEFFEGIDPEEMMRALEEIRHPERKLKAEFDKLHESYVGLSENYEKLQQENEELKKRIKVLESEVERLQELDDVFTPIGVNIDG